MEFETKIFLFFLIAWSFGLQMILTFSPSCYDTPERWVTFSIFVFVNFLYCYIRYKNYKKDTTEQTTNMIEKNYNYTNV